ncbi:hypothetical protein EDB85DRAFT_787494 [Lactarius pseudohatsudake]|nr:hypothetical protein EDB85DRAFT_1503838 [Lactarius pseudohatsudake]KAH9015873.1 hypothetical protein EDB85DRAFT_787494 [Lactarius pseudohatsudake]
MASAHLARSHRGPRGHGSRRKTHVCTKIYSKTKIDDGAGWDMLSRTDYELILERIARSHSWTVQPNCAHTRTAIVDYVNPGAWHGTSVTAPPPTTVACANDVEVLIGLLAALDSTSSGS